MSEGRGGSAVFFSGYHSKVLAMDCHRGPYDSFHKNSSMHFTWLSLFSKTPLCNGSGVE